MIAGPLKNNIQLSVIILLVICIGLWVNTIVFSSSYVPDVSYDEHVLYYFIFTHKLSFVATQIIACIVVLLGAFFVNFMAVQQEITSNPKQLWRPALAMLFAAPLAALIRAVILNSVVIPIFGIILAATSALGMILWRMIYYFLKCKQADT